MATAGFPFFSSSLPTISRGNVSRSLACMLQTTCCVQSGASGGPVVRWSTGKMLGMVVCNAISSSNAALYPRLNMAIPTSVLKGPLEEYLRTNGKHLLELTKIHLISFSKVQAPIPDFFIYRILI